VRHRAATAPSPRRFARSRSIAVHLPVALSCCQASIFGLFAPSGLVWSAPLVDVVACPDRRLSSTEVIELLIKETHSMEKKLLRKGVAIPAAALMLAAGGWRTRLPTADGVSV